MSQLRHGKLPTVSRFDAPPEAALPVSDSGLRPLTNITLNLRQLISSANFVGYINRRRARNIEHESETRAAVTTVWQPSIPIETTCR
ncbi:MAG: hypothetical protein ACI9DF_004511 [Verrucomicrobiales bacterium]|jgi:hypothetical protein